MTPLRAQSITAVEPLTARAGDTVSAKGEGIDGANVDPPVSPTRRSEYTPNQRGHVGDRLGEEGF